MFGQAEMHGFAFADFEEGRRYAYAAHAIMMQRLNLNMHI